MKNLFNVLILVSIAVVIWFLSSINSGINNIEGQLQSLDNNVYEIEMHTSGLEKPNEIMERRKQQKKSMENIREKLIKNS
jgi:predicted Holliday junction resolvase-like endonuclease